ncbi:hypothetical protein FQN57_002785 [Myotisia sp. PD_48]|nr:hypothetical protein FQN57_002785 [Myotisia sp. PD_48]
MEPDRKPKPGRRLVLCFDGTGNHYKGNESDSNVVKIYEMLDRNDKRQFHYYQPGIGTFAVEAMGAPNSWFGRIKSTVRGIIDKAVGTTFEYHVSSGYRFLMRYYKPGDDIYIFGFSRGAYTARFLAEMIEHVGLLSQGNEEMIRFVFASFSKVQRSRGKPNKSAKEIQDLLYLQKFKSTFCRPEVRVHFLGLFDCVNSVSQYEVPYSRHSYRYIAPSPAKHIRHAIAIHERRLKFKPELFTFEDDNAAADIKEVWFAGNHCDVGGGFSYEGDIKRLLSDIPLAWMIEEVISLEDCPTGQLKFHCDHLEAIAHSSVAPPVPCTNGQHNGTSTNGVSTNGASASNGASPRNDCGEYKGTHHHDYLVFGRGTPWYRTMMWWSMELLPFFTRLELEQNHWKPRYWPPNCGAERDIPTDAHIHISVEQLHRAGVLKKMPKLGGDEAPMLQDPLIVVRFLRRALPWNWGRSS